LRLTRWISLCSSLRTETGQFRGNIYAIHDAAVPMQDAIYLDPNYLDFVKKQTTHKNKTIRQLAEMIWQEIHRHSDDVVNNMITHNTTAITESLHQILHEHQTEKLIISLKTTQVQNLNLGENNQVQKLNPATKHQVQILNPADEKNNIQKNQTLNTQVQKLNPAPICSSSSSSLNNKFINKSTTTNSEGIFKTVGLKNEPVFDPPEDLIYPKAFNPNEINLAGIYLKKIEPELRQDFLDETAAQIKQRSKTTNPIRNPVGYLAWLCNQHQQGQTYLTSAYITLQQQRKRKQQTERKLKKQQQDITRAALSGEIERPRRQHEASRNENTSPSSKKQNLSRVAELKNAVIGKKQG
jgi:hypothetical protein